MIQAINTFYNGFYFRSRLEARWAVYFDLIQEQYEYEPQGLIFQDKYKYLPDFYLPKRKLLCEIKSRSAMQVDGIDLLSLNENANRYRAIAKDFQKQGMLYVIFMGSPYDYIFNNAKWWYDQRTTSPGFDEFGDYTFIYNYEVIDNAIRGILNDTFKDQAILAAKIRFEHDAKPEKIIQEFQREQKRRRITSELRELDEFFKARRERMGSGKQ